MCKLLSAPQSWNSLDKSILHESAKTIKKLSQQAISSAVIEDLQGYLGIPFDPSSKTSIQKRSLLGVKGASVIAHFRELPSVLHDGFLSIAGMARIVQTKEGIIPVVVLFPRINTTTLEHESIHLCQYLSEQAFLLTLSERKSLIMQTAEITLKSMMNTSPEKALDLLIRYVCYKVWIELEACYLTPGTKSPREILEHAQSSSQPFDSFENYLRILGIDQALPDAMRICQREFQSFCASVAAQVDWVQELVIKTQNETLNAALLECKEDSEMKALSANIDDDPDFDELLDIFDSIDDTVMGVDDSQETMDRDEFIKLIMGDDYAP